MRYWQSKDSSRTPFLKIKINKIKQKELYIILGNDSVLCGFDFLTRQSGICRQIIPHRYGQPFSLLYTELPSRHKSKKALIKPTVFPQKHFCFFVNPGQAMYFMPTIKSVHLSHEKVFLGTEDVWTKNALHPNFSSAVAVIFL